MHRKMGFFLRFVIFTSNDVYSVSYNHSHVTTSQVGVKVKGYKIDGI